MDRSVKATVRRMLIQYPMLFATKSDCFEHLFLVNGNGYDWHDGCLADVYSDKDDEPRWADENGDPRPGEPVISLPEIEKRLREQRILDAKRQNSNIRLVLENFDAIFNEPVRFINPYPVCEYSDLFHMPDDVKPDWRDACYEAAQALQVWLNGQRDYPIDEAKTRNRAFLNQHFADRVARMAEIARAVLAKE